MQILCLCFEKQGISGQMRCTRIFAQALTRICICSRMYALECARTNTQMLSHPPTLCLYLSLSLVLSSTRRHVHKNAHAWSHTFGACRSFEQRHGIEGETEIGLDGKEVYVCSDEIKLSSTVEVSEDGQLIVPLCPKTMSGLYYWHFVNI